jgi:RecA/RadA recombinase
MAEPAVDPLGTALARLETRWGSAALRVGTGTLAHPAQRTAGALALAVQPAPDAQPAVQPVAQPCGEPLSSGLPALDALLGASGLPRAAAAALHGAGSSGKTTLALHWLAQAQAQGAIATYLDLSLAFDPFEAACRGVDLRWLLVLRPHDPDEGFALAAALLGGRAIELLVVDLPDRLSARHEQALRRLAGHARRVGAWLIVLEPNGLPQRLHAALAESVGLRLELEQRGWLRVGRDIVGRRIGVNVVKNRYGPPGRQAELEIHYLADGEQVVPTSRQPAGAAGEPRAA